MIRWRVRDTSRARRWWFAGIWHVKHRILSLCAPVPVPARRITIFMSHELPRLHRPPLVFLAIRRYRLQTDIARSRPNDATFLPIYAALVALSFRENSKIVKFVLFGDTLPRRKRYKYTTDFCSFNFTSLCLIFYNNHTYNSFTSKLEATGRLIASANEAIARSKVCRGCRI